MKCEQVLKLLQEYISGETDTAASKSVARHLEHCISCRNEYNTLIKLQKQLKQLPRYVEPEKNLWPEIEKKITGSSGTVFARLKINKAAYFMTAAAIFLVFVMFFGHHSKKVLTDYPTATARPAYVSLAEIKNDYSRASGLLYRYVNSHRGSLDRETLETITANLAIIDQAMKNIDNALKKNGNDLQLIDFYKQAAEGQLTLLQQTISLIEKKERKIL